MTGKKIILWMTLFTVMLVSCNNIIQKPDDDLPPLGENEFYAQNIKTGKYYIVKANMMYAGKNCVIWAEENSGITQENAEEIAHEYDDIIRPTIVGAFSIKDFDVQGKDDIYHFDDILDYANRLANGDDGKLTILLLDIKDGFNNQDADSYVAGYFFGGNFYPEGKISGSKYYSNGRDMIYVDTSPGLEMEPTQTYANFAHELQHLINFVTTVLMDRNLTDTWIDEGLSSQAEYLYLGENPSEKCKWFKEDIKGTIAKGNNFFVWDNHREEPLAILDDYATVYLFFRWLYLQANTGLQSHIFYDIETSNSHDYHAVAKAAGSINPSWSNWETLLGTWLAANYYPGNTYGYKNDNYLQETITVKPVAGQTISLYPGEGVYSYIKDYFSSAGISGINIRYAGLTGNETITSPPYTGNVLLTFNANTKNTANPEIGYLTGVLPPASQTAARNIQTRTLTGPYVIDARDMLNRAEKR